MYHNSPKERPNPALLLLPPPKERQHQLLRTLKKQQNKTNTQTNLNPNRLRLKTQDPSKYGEEKRKGREGPTRAPRKVEREGGKKRGEE